MDTAESIREGEEALITEGVKTGQVGLVTRLIPGRDRVLPELLGLESEADIALDSVTHPGDVRPSLGGASG